MRGGAVVVSALALMAVASAQVGRVDTIGGTTYDWQLGGPQYRFVADAGGLGVHVIWLHSASTSGSTFPDRNYRYNYFDFSSGVWNWMDPDYMASGVSAYSERVGFGSLANEPRTNAAVIVAHGGSPLRPILARDLASGAGTFEYCDGSPNAEAYQWPVLALDSGGAAHICCIDNATQDAIWYTRCDPWCTWSVPVGMAGTVPDPMFPGHSIAASPVSQKVCVAWEYSEGTPYEPMYYRTSSDAGTTWADPVELARPDAYRGDTVTTFHITSCFPWFDRQDRLHFVAGVVPIVRETTYILPAEIWHWCESNTPQWHKVHRAGCAPENLQAAVGYDAVYACRPSIGGDARGNLFVTWEQFDSANVEPATNLLRAGVWLALSTDDGSTWLKWQITAPGLDCSHRFPSVVDWFGDVVLRVSYMLDLQAGFYVQGQGAVTQNPIVVQHVHVDSLPPGITSRPAQPRLYRQPLPSVVRGVLFLSEANGERRQANGVLLDAAGREVMTLRPGPNDVRNLPAGVYFVRREDSRSREDEGTSLMKVVIER